ncbi:RHS repeat-associated core domain-containing protein [Achromobacter spanius]|uniref:RHS repeat-associated core domain-containing protein n=1 Tax=Achromobacter spanius TaxID=217203 RepID=UPI003F68DB89
MLGRILSLVAALLLASASASAYVPERSIASPELRVSGPKTASRDFAQAAEPAAKGKAAANNCRVWEIWSPPQSLTSSMGFTGYYADAESGQYYAQQRYYKQGIGRFNRVDPWEGDTLNPITLNKYLAFSANPLRFLDPDGRQSIEINLPSCTEDGSCGTAPIAGSALPFLGPSQMATPEQADALIESQARLRLFGGDANSPMVVQPMLASGAGQFKRPYIVRGTSPQLSTMQSSAELDQALGLNPNYAGYGRGLEATGEAAFHSLPPVAYAHGLSTIYNRKDNWDLAAGLIEATAGMSPLVVARLGAPRALVVKEAGVDPTLIAERRMALIADSDFGPINQSSASTPRTGPICGSGGPCSVYEIPAAQLVAEKPYIGKTRRAVPSRMNDADHRAKTAAGNAPEATVLAENMTPEEAAGVEAILAHERGMENLSNAIPPLNMALPKNAAKIEAGRRVLERARAGSGQ